MIRIVSHLNRDIENRFPVELIAEASNHRTKPLTRSPGLPGILDVDQSRLLVERTVSRAQGGDQHFPLAR